MSESLIKSLSKYISLTKEEMHIVESLFIEKKFRKHQYILQEGDIARHETYIIRGVTRSYEVNEKGEEHVIQFGLEGWWVGDLFSFLSRTPTRYNIDCLEDSTVQQITFDNLELLYRQVPKLERHFRIVFQNAFIASTKRISSSLSMTALERYEEFVRCYPHIEQRVPNHQIASYLGITPQSLSRVRSQAVSRNK